MALTSYEALDMLVSKLDEARISEIEKSIKSEFVKRLLRKATPIEEIAELTDMSSDEIIAVRSTMV